MNDSLRRTVRIQRSAKGGTEDPGREVSAEPVEEMELELVSTLRLKEILGSGSADRKRQLDELAASRDGVLAKNLGSGNFEIISDDELKAALTEASKSKAAAGHADADYQPGMARTDSAAGELSLVSTQALRKILGHVEEKADDEDLSNGGFDPYNNG